MDEKDLKEALEATTEKGATRSGYEQLIRQKLALKDDVDLSAIDDDTLKAMAGTDEDAMAEISKDAAENGETKVTFGDQLGLEDKEDIEAVNNMSDEDKDKLVAAVAGDKENMKESVSWTVECYNLMEAADIDLAIALKEHCGLKKDEVKEILKERKAFGTKEGKFQETGDFLDRVLEAAKKINFESIHEVFEDDEPEATHISNASTIQSDFVPAQPSLEKAPAKLKESEDIATSPALGAELEKAGQNFFKTELKLKFNPGNNMLYAYGDLGWQQIGTSKKHYSVHVSIQGGKVAYYQVHENHAYDEAEYYWAYSFNLKTWYFKNGDDKAIAECSTIKDVLEKLAELNQEIRPIHVYDSMKPGSQGPKIEESTLTDALDDAMDHLRAAERHNDDYDTYAVEQDLRGAEGKIHKAQMIAR